MYSSAALVAALIMHVCCVQSIASTTYENRQGGEGKVSLQARQIALKHNDNITDRSKLLVRRVQRKSSAKVNSQSSGDAVTDEQRFLDQTVQIMHEHNWMEEKREIKTEIVSSSQPYSSEEGKSGQDDMHEEIGGRYTNFGAPQFIQSPDYHNEYTKAPGYAQPFHYSNEPTNSIMYKPAYWAPKPTTCAKCIPGISFVVCEGDDQEIGCFSCMGDFNCVFSNDITIGSKSCVGSMHSCSASSFLNAGDMSCVGDHVCEESESLTVKSNGCHGDLSCSFSESAYIGRGSCLESSACTKSSRMEADDEACIGNFACTHSYSMEASSWSCVGTGNCAASAFLRVEEGSCVGHSTCFGSQKVKVGQDSCHGAFTCLGSPYSTFGSMSCRGLGTCSLFYGDVRIGDESCIGDYTCSHLRDDVEIAPWSCQGEFACSDLGEGVKIDSNACNCDGCCIGLPAGCHVASGFCNHPDYVCISGQDVCENLAFHTEPAYTILEVLEEIKQLLQQTMYSLNAEVRGEVDHVLKQTSHDLKYIGAPELDNVGHL